jgi:hypothetical protein
VLQNTVNQGQTRFTGTVSELSPTAEAHILAIYQNQLWLSAILGSGENATTVWVPLGRAGMVKTHIQTIPVFTWNVDNVFGSTDVTVQAYDTNGYAYFPSIQVTEETITVTHTAETAGRLVVISTDNLFSGAPDTGIAYEFFTTFAGFPQIGQEKVIYVARDTSVAYYYDTGAYHSFGTTVEVVNNLITNDPAKALSAAQGVALKALTDALNETKLDASDVIDNLTSTDGAAALSANQGRVLKGLIDTINSVLQTDDGTLDELQEIVDYIKLNRADLESLNIASIAGLQAALDLKADITAIPVQYVNFLTGTSRDPFYSQDKTVLGAIPQGIYQFTALPSAFPGLNSSVAMEFSVVVFGTTSKRISFVAQENATNKRFTRHCNTALSNGVDNNVVWSSDWNLSIPATVDNLTSPGSIEPLTANQGYVLKQLTDGLEANKVGINDTRLTNAREWTASTVSQADAEAGISTSRFAFTPLRVFQAIAAWWASSTFKTKLDGIETGAQVNTVTSVASKTGAVTLVKADVGLANVDNTSDANKPVSTAQQTALNLKLNIASVVNNLTAGGTTVPLSAEQGKVLKGLIDSINTLLTSDDTTLDELQEIVDYIKLNRAELDSLSIASIAGLQAALDLKVDTSDARLTDAREWTAATITQAEAEAGTATTRRAWTAQRVFQAINAWWNASAMKTKLDGIQAGAQVNVATNLGVGTRTTTTVPVTSSTGSSASLPVATTSLAGVMSSADKTKLDGIAAGAQVNVATNLSITRVGLFDIDISSSTGNTITLLNASATDAGLMRAVDRSRLDDLFTKSGDGTLLNKYSLLLGTSTGAVNLATSQVWKITDPGSTRTISITNPPAATRSMSVVLQVIGNRATNWPAGVQWADGLAPVLAANWTMIILTYIDGVVYGSVGPSA